MNILLKSVKVIDKHSEYNGKTVDILIKDGRIKKIGKNIFGKNERIIKLPNLHVSCGWIDMKASFCDPGFEYKENIFSGMDAAADGGFTEVVLMPSTVPVIDSKSDVEYLINKSKGYGVTIHPVGALSANMKGEELSGMYDMQCAGAVAFTDNKQTVVNSGLMQRALLYARNFNGLIISFTNEINLTHNGMMHEGVMSTKLGLMGMPTIAEEIQIKRDICLAQYTEAPIHLSGISSKEGVAEIRKAKKEGIPVTSEVYAHQLVVTDESLFDFDTNYKVIPPFRSQDDINALIKGIVDGTIDCVCSDHTPEDPENKVLEFENAAFGIIGLQTAFGCVRTATRSKLSLDLLIEKFTTNPRMILKLKPLSVSEGNPANLTLFDPDKKWTFTKEDVKSKSFNSPFFGKEFIGKPLGIINNGKLIISD